MQIINKIIKRDKIIRTERTSLGLASINLVSGDWD